ncbi:TPA: sensor histidine kinase [Streptococcus suis]|nr:sensor histidine kinase [Streptococcus suis]
MIAKFIREYRSFYFSYIVLATSFILLFFLYQLPSEFLQNALLLSLTLLILLTAGLFWKFRNRMRALEDYVHEEALPLLNKPVDLAYLNLIEAEKEATREQLLDYKSREEDLQAMVKMWSHQMKVPLAALSLMSQTDNLNQLDVNHQLLRLDNYMANLLNYLKLTNHTSDFRFEQVEVREVVVDLVKKYRNQFLQKDISVTIDGNWLLKTDRKWLSFALSQIIDNALKYNKTGGNVAIELNNGGISISDTGIGILSEDLPRLFDEGFTGFNGREHQKATGFGLYLTKRVLNQLELAISVESQLEVGTSVSITKVQ